MRSLVATLTIGCFLTTATSCVPSDACDAAAAKLSECSGRPMEAMPACDADSAEQILLSNCDQINTPGGKALDGWIIAAVAAAVVGGAIWFSTRGNGQTTAATNSPASSSTPNYTPNNTVPYSTQLPPINTSKQPVNYVAPTVTTGPLTNSYAASGAQPASSSPASAASPAGTTGRNASPSDGPAAATNARGCANLAGDQQCIGSMTNGPSRGYGFAAVPKTRKCKNGHEFRICKNKAGACGLEYCMSTGDHYSGECSADILKLGNSANPGFSSATVDGKALGCGGASNPYLPPSVASNPPACSVAGNACGPNLYCTAVGCVQRGSVSENGGCMDSQGRPITELCGPGLACSQSRGLGGEIQHVCKPPSTGSGSCPATGCGDWSICTPTGCQQPYRRQLGQSCEGLNNRGEPALCASQNCGLSGLDWICVAAVAPTPTPTPAPGGGGCGHCANDEICVREMPGNTVKCAEKHGAALMASCVAPDGRPAQLRCDHGLQCSAAVPDPIHGTGWPTCKLVNQDRDCARQACPRGTHCIATGASGNPFWRCRAPQSVAEGSLCVSSAGNGLTAVCDWGGRCEQVNASPAQTIRLPAGNSVKQWRCRR